MIRLEAETGIVLTSICTLLLAVLLLVNVSAGNWYLAAFNLASIGLAVFLFARWIEIREKRRRLAS